MPSPLSPNALDVRRLDRDRFVTTLFAPPARREALFGVYAFNQELARVPELVSEPLLGRIRLQWWRDAVETLYGGGDVAHPIAQAIGEAIREHGLSRWPLDRLIDVREDDLEASPPASLRDLEAFADATAATLNALALEVLGVREDVAFTTARHLGIAWGLTGLLRAVPFHAAWGRLYLPLDLLAEQGVDSDDVLAGHSSPGLAKVAEVVAARAREHLDIARGYAAEIPKQALPGLLTAPLTEAYLTALAKVGFDPLDRRWSRTRPRPARLTWNVFRGRY